MLLDKSSDFRLLYLAILCIDPLSIEAALTPNVRIVTDSTCCLPQEVVDEYNIRMVPLQIVYQGNSYRDRIDMTPNEVYRIMRRREGLPTTSNPLAGDFLNAFIQASREAESVLCITVTGQQSKTYEAACLARQLAENDIRDTAIEVFDSRAVAGALGFIVLEAARKAAQGADLAQVSEVARNIRGRVHALFILDTLYYLAKTGRIARAAAWAGAILNMKPVLEHSPSIGETTPVARTRSRAKAVNHMLDVMSDRVNQLPVHVIVQHADEQVEGEKLVAEINSRFSCTELYLTEFSTGMGVHTGPGVLAVSFYAD